MKDSKKIYKTIIVLLSIIIIILFTLLFKSCKKDEPTNALVSTTEIESTTMFEEKTTSVNDEEIITTSTTKKSQETDDKTSSTETTTIKQEITTENTKSHSTAIPGYELLNLNANTKQQNIALENPSTNECYFKITLLLEDGTTLWKSDLIKPGKKSEAITLTQELSKGSYKAILRYECYSMDGSMRQMNGAETKLSLRVN